jgi:hypothetical protein
MSVNETIEKHLSETTAREKYLDKLGVDALKPRIQNVIKELEDIAYYMQVSTNAHMYSKNFGKIIDGLKKFDTNFKPKYEKPKKSGWGGNINAIGKGNISSILKLK